jgi:4-hydroxy-tetrahydrodipicolinate synthase
VDLAYGALPRFRLEAARELRKTKKGLEYLTMLRGSLTALVTPFDKGGRFDEKAFRAFVDWQIAEGTTGLVPVGTTGESPTLSHDEHRQVVKTCIDAAKGRVPVVAGAGSNNTEEAVGLVKFAEEAGADAVLVVTPYYNKPTQRGLYAHFAAVAKATTLPVIIYNIPPRSVIDMTPETMGRLAHDFKNIAGVKDATGKVERVSEQRMTCGKDFIQLSGEDASALGFNAHGGVGCISVTANVAPRLCAEFQAATLDNDKEKALDLQDRLMPLHRAIFIEPGLAGAKYALSRLGKVENVVRSPLTTVEEGTAAKIDAAMKFAGLIN